MPDCQNLIMEQVLHYRGIRYVISHEQSGRREWVIYPPDGPDDGAERGMAAAESLRGSFKAAVHAAQRTIDALLDGTGLVNPEGTYSPAAPAPG